MGRGKTDLYKEHVQRIIEQELGEKVSKDKAWTLFKAIIHGTVEFTLNQEDLKLPLAGVGNFEILKTKPRGSKAGLDKEGNPIEGATPWEFVPRFRFYPSVAVDRVVENSFDFGDHDIEPKHYGIYVEDLDEVPEESEPQDAPEPEVGQAPEPEEDKVKVDKLPPEEKIEEEDEKIEEEDIDEIDFDEI